MGLRINTNLSALGAMRGLNQANQALGRSYRRLSTGLRINSAADDPAGLAISERLRAQIRSIDQASRNANDGISLVQTAEGSLGEVNTMLSRMRELAVQAGNGTLSNADRETLDQEFQSLSSEINRISQSTEFNGINLLDGSASSVSFQVGTGTNPSINSLSVSLSPSLSTSLGLSTLDIGSGGNSSFAIGQLDAAIDQVSNLRGSFGAAHSRLSSSINHLSVQGQSLTAADSRIRDTDVALETSLLARHSILQRASLAVLAQANSLPRNALSLLQ